MITMPTLWVSKQRKAHHILLENYDSNPSKCMPTLSELGQVLWNCLAFLYIDFMKFILQCQLPLITYILIQVRQCFPHSMRGFLSMETRDNMISNSPRIIRLAFTTHFFHSAKFCASIVAGLGISFSTNSFKPLSYSITSILSLQAMKFELPSKAYLSLNPWNAICQS